MKGRKANRIREWLLPKLADRGMTVAQFAGEVGLSRAAIYLYLNDQCRPTAFHMAKMCRVLGVPLREGLAQYVPKPLGRPAKRRPVSRPSPGWIARLVRG
jgi:transcriptional regulator with XRE-family HTH domain